ncbi:hypothetical protein LINPERHAP1_LOCUS30329 [Linum perenne]
MDRVMRRRPHSIDGCLVNLVPWMTPSPKVFNDLRFASFWVRLEDVLTEFRSLNFGTGLLQPIGEVLYTGLYDSRSKNKELIRGFGLPTVCFGCGMLGHSLRQCPFPFVDGSCADNRGSWMQVDKLTYHQVKTGGVKRPVGSPGSGEGTSAVGEVPVVKLPKLGPQSAGLGQVTPAALGRVGFSATGPKTLEAPVTFSSGLPPLITQTVGLDSVPVGRSSASAQGEDNDMVDFVSGPDGGSIGDVYGWL